MLLAKKHACQCNLIAEVVYVACQFRARDEHHKLFPKDQEFAEKAYPLGMEPILTNICHLSREELLEAEVMDEILSVSSVK